MMTAVVLSALPGGVHAAPDMSAPYADLPYPEGSAPSSVSVSRDGSIIAVATSMSGNLTVYSVAEQAKLWTATNAWGSRGGAEVSGDGERVLAFDGLGTVRMYRTDGGGQAEWAHSLNEDVFNIATSYDGTITVAGTAGAVHLFDQSGHVRSYHSGGSEEMRVAMSLDGQVIYAIAGSYLYYLAPDLSAADAESLGGTLGSPWQGDVGLEVSDDGQTVVASYLDYGASKLVVVKRQPSSIHYFYPTFGGGSPRFALSGDGSTVLLTDNDGIHLYDTLSRATVWSRAAGAQLSGVSISPDGAEAFVSYPYADTILAYGKGSAEPSGRWTVDDPSHIVMSRDGSTMVVAGGSISVFRATIQLEVTAPGEVDPPGPMVLGFRATANGEPVLGAEVGVTINGTAPYCEVRELGGGHYQVTVYSVPTSYCLVDLSVSRDGLGSASERVPVIVGPYVFDPDPYVPNYDYAFYELRSQIGGLQSLVALLAAVSAVTMVILVLFVGRARKA